MTIKNFEANLPANKLESGRDYFSREKIMELAEARSGRWTAAVWSRKYLELTIDFNGNTITGASCGCKSISAPEDYCTHIIAMLYAVQYAKGLIPEREAFINSDPGALGGKWAKETDREAMAKYAKMIREPFNAAKDITGDIYRDQTNKVMRIPGRLLDEARKAFEEERLTEALNITLAVIETVTYCSLKLEHGDNSVLNIYYPAFELLTEILAQSPSKAVMGRLYEHGVSGGIEMKDSIDAYHTFWIEFLVKNRLCPKEDTELQELIDTLVKRARQKRLGHVEEELLDLKARYAESSGMEKVPATEEADEQPETKEKTTVAVKAKATVSASLLPQSKTPQDSPSLVKALEQAKKEDNKKRVEMYRQCILSERRSRNDKMGVREIAIELFTENPTESYLDLIRETYTQVQWEQEEKKFRQRLKKAKAK